MPAKNPLSRCLGVLEFVVAWLLRYPLLMLQMLIFFLVAWGRLGYELGAEDLLWSEHIGEQILNGIGCGLLFGEILLVRYLLDQTPRVPLPISLFPVADTGVRDLGNYLLILWVPSLVLLGGGKLFYHEVWSGEVRVWPFFVGLLVAVGASSGVIALFSQWGLLDKLPRRLLSPGNPMSSLHGVAMLTTGLAALFLLILYVLHFWGASFSPIVVLCVLLGLADAVYGFLAFWWPGSQYAVLVLLVGSALLVSSSAVDRNHAYKLTFPNLEDRYANPLPLEEVRLPDEDGKHVRVDRYYELLRKQAEGKDKGPDLIDSEEPLQEMAKRWGHDHPGDSKPRLVLIATSGGGIRAAVWTAVVLDGLEHEIGAPFRDHIRMFTGASGGMVGAALYVADFECPPDERPDLDPSTGLGGLSRELARDSLRRTVQTMLLQDLPTLWRPGRLSWDRGRAIEAEWAKNTSRKNGHSPYNKSFEDLKALEKKGLRPSLVFSPMLVEDARRLLISNLDLLDLTWTSGAVLGFEPIRKQYRLPDAPDKPLFSLEAVELFRLFPCAQGKFEIGTASRMNASFPLVSPGVSLPTEPPRRVVDAGYYDNYGVNLAARWLYRHEQAIRKHTSGVALIEIRAYRNGYARWHFQDKEAEKYHPNPSHEDDPNHPIVPRRDQDALAASLEWLSTPFEALLTARDRAAYYHNDELLDGLDRHFNHSPHDFFTSVAFECEVDAALSWTLPSNEARRIARAFYRRRDAAEPADRMPPWIRSRVAALKNWLGEGGKAP